MFSPVNPHGLLAMTVRVGCGSAEAGEPDTTAGGRDPPTRGEESGGGGAPAAARPVLRGKRSPHQGERHPQRNGQGKLSWVRSAGTGSFGQGLV